MDTSYSSPTLGKPAHGRQYLGKLGHYVESVKAKDKFLK